MLSRPASLIPNSPALSQPLLGFSPNDHIFAPNWDTWSDRPEYLKFRLFSDLDSGCTLLPGLAHFLHAGIRALTCCIWAPIFLCLPGLIEQSLKRHRALIPHLLLQGSLSQPVGEGGSGTVIAMVLKCAPESGCVLLLFPTFKFVFLGLVM